MRIVGSLRRRFESEAPAEFECTLCAMRFEHRPSNCPACGSIDIRET